MGEAAGHGQEDMQAAGPGDHGHLPSQAIHRSPKTRQGGSRSHGDTTTSPSRYPFVAP